MEQEPTKIRITAIIPSKKPSVLGVLIVEINEFTIYGVWISQDGNGRQWVNMPHSTYGNPPTPKPVIEIRDKLLEKHIKDAILQQFTELKKI